MAGLSEVGDSCSGVSCVVAVRWSLGQEWSRDCLVQVPSGWLELSAEASGVVASCHPPLVACALAAWGSLFWVVSIPRGPGGSSINFHDLTLEITLSLAHWSQGNFEPHHSVWEEAHFHVGEDR